MLYQQAKTWKVRPSSLLNIQDNLVAYFLDEVVAFFGNGLANDLESIEGKTSKERQGKAKLMIHKRLGLFKGTAKQFRDPAAAFKK